MKINLNKKIFLTSSIVIILFVIFFSFSSNTTFGGSQKLTSTIALDLINHERENHGLIKIEIDENLCILAKLLAEDSELAYPEDINKNLSSNIKYKKYLKDYPMHVTSTSSINDILVNFYKYSKREIPPISDEQIAQQSIGSPENKGPALEPSITHGCTYASSGKAGYKPFGYFVAGTKNIALFERIKQMLFNFIADKFRF